MKTTLLSFALSILLVSVAFSQDIIFKKTGEEIKGKVLAITISEIEYKKNDTIDKASYKIPKSEVIMVKYSNGTNEVFTASSPEVAASNNNQQSSRKKQKFYGYDFFEKNVPVTYLGIDFSLVSVVGKGFETVPVLFKEINELIEKEKNKYDVDGAIRKPTMRTDYSIVEKKNELLKESDLVEENTNRLNYSDLQKIVEDYDLSSATINESIVVVFIAESLSKTRMEGAYYFVVFDSESRTILISERLVGKAGGNGPRNYWGKSIYECITEIKNSRYINWKVKNRRR